GLEKGPTRRSHLVLKHRQTHGRDHVGGNILDGSSNATQPPRVFLVVTFSRKQLEHRARKSEKRRLVIQLFGQSGRTTTQAVSCSRGIESHISRCFQSDNQPMHCAFGKLERTAQFRDSQPTHAVTERIEDTKCLDQRFYRPLISSGRPVWPLTSSCSRCSPDFTLGV